MTREEALELYSEYVEHGGDDEFGMFFEKINENYREDDL